MSDPKIGFELRRLTLSLESILPVKKIEDPENRIVRYATIRASIKELGLIEPLMVYPQRGGTGMYLLMDGHLRYAVLKELGQTEAECLISTQDECFTYNARISRLAPIQEHAMIKRAVQSGVPAERIAAALNMKTAQVNASVRLMDGVHAEAADLLKSTAITPKALYFMKKVSPVRQIEMAELMVSANNFTRGYAEALYVATPKSQLLEPEKPKTKPGMAAEEIARMEHEMEGLERDFKALEASYAGNMLNLTFVRGYVKKLMENARVARFFIHKNAVGSGALA